MNTGHPAEQLEDVPRDVTDVLLWRLAAKVLVAHQPQPDRPTRCTSLLCAGQHYPCLPARAAHRAQRLSRTSEPAAAPTSETPQPPARARAVAAVPRQPREPQLRHGFTDWATAIRTTINSHRTPPTAPPARPSLALLAWVT